MSPSAGLATSDGTLSGTTAPPVSEIAEISVRPLSIVAANRCTPSVATAASVSVAATLGAKCPLCVICVICGGTTVVRADPRKNPATQAAVDATASMNQGRVPMHLNSATRRRSRNPRHNRCRRSRQTRRRSAAPKPHSPSPPEPPQHAQQPTQSD